MRSFNFFYLGLWLTRLVGSVGILAIGVGLAWGQDVPLLPGERGLPIYPSPPPMQEAEPQLNEKLIDTTYYPEPFSIPASIRNTLLGDTTLGDSIDKFLPDTLGDTLKRRNLNKLSPFPRQDSPQLSIKKPWGGCYSCLLAIREVFAAKGAGLQLEFHSCLLGIIEAIAAKGAGSQVEYYSGLGEKKRVYS